MLINRIRDTYREITGYIEPAAPVTIVPEYRPSANADRIAKSDMLARCRRRQRRTVQIGLRNINGWAVRTW